MTRKTVAIRGLDTGLYNEVFSMAKKDGKRVSDLVNSALKAYIDGDTTPEKPEESVASGVGRPSRRGASSSPWRMRVRSRCRRTTSST